MFDTFAPRAKDTKEALRKVGRTVMTGGRPVPDGPVRNTEITRKR